MKKEAETRTEKAADIKQRCVDLIHAYKGNHTDLAKASGIPAGSFRQYSTGRSAIPYYYLEDFCREVGVSVEYIITGSENPIVEAYYGLDEDERKIAGKFLGINQGERKKNLIPSVSNSHKSAAHGKRHS